MLVLRMADLRILTERATTTCQPLGPAKSPLQHWNTLTFYNLYKKLPCPHAQLPKRVCALGLTIEHPLDSQHTCEYDSILKALGDSSRIRHHTGSLAAVLNYIIFDGHLGSQVKVPWGHSPSPTPQKSRTKSARQSRDKLFCPCHRGHVILEYCWGPRSMVPGGGYRGWGSFHPISNYSNAITMITM